MRGEQRDFLVEIGTEELPPKALLDLSQAFLALLQAGLLQAGLGHGEMRSFATPRRLAVWVKRLAARQPEQNLKRRGPPVSAAFDAAGNPTRAALLDVLTTLGAHIAVLNLEEKHAELVGTVQVSAPPDGLRSTAITGALAAQLIDELPVLAAIAPYTRGGIRIRDARELRVKESDRLAGSCLTISQRGQLQPGIPHDDALRIES